MSALEVTDLHHRYGQHEALGGLSFSVAAGDVFAVLGARGAGKSTLLNIVGTLAAPTSGTVEIFGIDVLTKPNEARWKTGVMFSSPALDPWLTVFENLRHHGYLYGLSGHQLARAIERSLERVGLMARASNRVSALTGDVRRRVELAKAILPEPQLLVIDDPGHGLDPAATRELIQDLKRLRDDAGTTIVFSTAAATEAVMADRVGILQKGRLTAIGKTADLTDPIGRLDFMMLATYSLWRRELLRFLRRPNCSLSALALPVILYFGADSLRPSSFTLVGSVTLILVLVASVDDPANEFLQGVHASPAPRVSVVLGKALAGVTLALVNVVILLLLTLLWHR